MTSYTSHHPFTVHLKNRSQRDNGHPKFTFKSKNQLDEYDVAKMAILPYLKNVKVNIEDINVKDIGKGYKYREKDIYDPMAERKTIWNLDKHTPQYLAFLKFMAGEFKQINDQYAKNEGDIITSHLFNLKDTESEKILEQYKAKYIANFIDNINDKNNNHYTNKQGKMYPHFIDDIMEKNRRLQFEDTEILLGINTQSRGIQNHTPLQFLEIIIKRLEGLFNCYKTKIESLEYSNENSYYFKHELLNEIKQLKQILEIRDVDLDLDSYLEEVTINKTKINEFMESNFLQDIEKNITIIKDKLTSIIKSKSIAKANVIVKEHCKHILRGPNDYKYNQELNNEITKLKKFNEFKRFIDDENNNPNELLFLKTFMINCFKKDINDNYTNEIDWKLVYEQMGNRTYRQMFFGFEEYIKKYQEFKSFYEVLASNNIGINKPNIKNCSYLVIWSLFVNFYYNKCSITNTDIDIPIRFKLPTEKIIRKPLLNMTTKYKSSHYSQYSYDFRSLARNQNIFENDNIKFIGFINIKIYYNNDDNNQFRNWTLFVFHNTSQKAFTNYVTGELFNYPIFSYELELINVGSLVARDPATHEEIKFFQAESEKDENNVFIYISLLDKDNHTLFITYKDISDLDYLKDLQLERVLIHDSGRNITHDRKKRFIQIIPYIEKDNDKILYSIRNNRFRSLGRTNRTSHTGGGGGGGSGDHTKIKSISKTKRKYKATKHKATKHKLKFTKIVKT